MKSWEWQIFYDCYYSEEFLLRKSTSLTWSLTLSIHYFFMKKVTYKYWREENDRFSMIAITLKSFFSEKVLRWLGHWHCQYITFSWKKLLINIEQMRMTEHICLPITLMSFFSEKVLRWLGHWHCQYITFSRKKLLINIEYFDTKRSNNKKTHISILYVIAIKYFW